MITGALLLATLSAQDPTCGDGFVLERLAAGYPLAGPVVLAVDERGPVIVQGGASAAGATVLRLAWGAPAPEVVARDRGPVTGLLDRSFPDAVVLGGGRLRWAGGIDLQGDPSPLATGLPLDARGPVVALDGDLYVATSTQVLRVDRVDGSIRRVAGGFVGLSGLVAMPDGALVAHDAHGLVQVLPGVDGGVPIDGGASAHPESTAGLLLPGGRWPEPCGEALYWAFPESGEVQRIELIPRGAGYAVGVRASVLKGDPESFRPTALAASPSGHRLVVASAGAGGAVRLWVLAHAETAPPLPALRGPEDPRFEVRLDWQLQRAARTEDRLLSLDALERSLVAEARPFDPSARRRPGAREQLFGALASPRARRHAVWALAAFRREVDPDVRRRAGLLLERCVAHEAPEVREQAARALADWPDELIEPDRLVGLLRDDAAAVRCAAAYAVTAREYRLAGRELVSAFDGAGDPALVAALRAALVELRAWDPIIERIARLAADAERRAALWSLLADRRDEDAVYAVARLAREPQVNFRMRREALEVLTSLWQPTPDGDVPWPGNARVRRTLEAALEDEAPAVREQAAAGLARINE